ncbi:MAG: YciI family protein [Pseudonocardia sp.]
MIIVKGSSDSEAGVLPSEELLTAMGRYNEELVKAGVMLAGDGLHPSSKGVRVRFSGEQRTVIDGPFTEAKELIAGYWLWQVRSLDEAIEWVKRAPFDGGSEIEIRQVFEADDFGDALPPSSGSRSHVCASRLPSVRGDLLARLGRHVEARGEFERAASITRNERERALLTERAAACARLGSG